MRFKILQMNHVPKLRSEREMEEIIHRWKVVGRKREIQLLKDDLLLQEPFATLSYTNPEQRKNLLKVGWKLLVATLRNLIP